MAMLLLYPLVFRIKRFNLLRHWECSPSFRLTSLPFPTKRRLRGSQPYTT